MTKKTYIGIAVGIIALGTAITLAQPNNQNETGQTASPQTTENSYDFGKISMAEGIVQTSFTLRNDGTEPLTIQKMYTSCMCTVATLRTNTSADPGGEFGPFGMPGHGFIPSIDAVLRPQEEATIDVEFDPAAHGPAGIGRIERTILIETDKEPVEFFIAATVIP